MGTHKWQYYQCCGLVKTSNININSTSNSDPDYSLPIDSSIGDTITGHNIVATLKNGAFITASSDYKYIELDGNNDYVDLGDNTANCLGNVVHCPDGLTLSMWLKPTKLQNGRQWYVQRSNKSLW